MSLAQLVLLLQPPLMVAAEATKTLAALVVLVVFM
jgi:hypothetical protein